MSLVFRKQLEILENSGIPVKTLTAADLYPFWEDSDPRLKHFGDEEKKKSVLDVAEELEQGKNPKYRLLLCTFIEGLGFWKDYQALRSEISSSDPYELAKFDAEFRRYVSRKQTQTYEDDFEPENLPILSASNPENAPTDFNSTFDRDSECNRSEYFGDTSTFSRFKTISFTNIVPQPVRGNYNQELYEEDSLELDTRTETKTFFTPAELAQTEADINDLLFPEDQFIIKKFIAKGGEGKVYVAEDVVTKDLVALKQFEAPVEERDAFIAIISKEAQLMKSFCHPNIVKCLGLYMPQEQTEGMITVSIVMEYIEGGSLADKLKTKGPFSLEEIKDLCKDILEGLDYLHGLNIIYRDIKPSNILCGDLLKITDFGISTQLREIETIPRSCAGTPWYMAPEVILGEPYSYAADIWSLGCLVYELYTGSKPFKTAGLTRVLHLMVDCLNPLDCQEEPLPQDLEDFLLKCWRRPYSLRPSAKELLGHRFLV
ncbi:unnamed protein product [Blepharisma stoltei]|uniref:Protein kinase domain-containing protein n=1 Tax=Blepharisma stoltei TaxID=1481888 RepID=A0AAU9JTU0_9CILI|nr:unnamed protein product [Blepharisma stoltei]